MPDTETLEYSQRGISSTGPVAALTVLAHVDVSRVAARAYVRIRTELGRRSPLFEPALDAQPLALEDPFLSRTPLLLVPQRNGVLIERANSPIELSVDGKTLEKSMWLGEAELERGVLLELRDRVVLLLSWVPQPRPALTAHGLWGQSAGTQRVREEIDSVAGLDVPVLIRGESGVGKELVARAVHEAGSRSGGHYEAVNMAAIPADVAASELFGHEKGSFTGATRRHWGCFARAHLGTLFLDEIGDTPLEVQPQLLRALDTRDIRPIGAASSQTVDVRVIAATDLDFDAAIARGAFREALLQRLAGYQIFIPPLRERREDIAILFYHFMRQELIAMGQEDLLMTQDPKRPWIPAKVVARLMRHSWPGNVRELRNVVRQLAVSGRTQPVIVGDAELERLLQTRPSQTAPPRSTVESEVRNGLELAEPSEPANKRATSSRPETYVDPSEVTEDKLLAALSDNDYRLAPTAKQLGVSRTSLYALIEQSARIPKATELARADIERALSATHGSLIEAARQLRVSAHALKLRVAALGLKE